MKSFIKLWGVWISKRPGCWQRNTTEIVKPTVASIPMITKLQLAGAPFHKLLHLYCLFVRSSTEFCSVVWHGNLTVDQSRSIERLQIVSLKVILGEKAPKNSEGFFDYQAALRICGLKSLFFKKRRENYIIW